MIPPPVLADITQSCSPGCSQALGRVETGGRSGRTSGWGLRVGSVPFPDSLFPHSQIIRVQSPEGVKRITATKRETVATFLKKVPRDAQGLPTGLPWLCPLGDPCFTSLAQRGTAFHVGNTLGLVWLVLFQRENNKFTEKTPSASLLGLPGVGAFPGRTFWGSPKEVAAGKQKESCGMVKPAAPGMAQLLGLGLEYRLDVLCVVLVFQCGFGESRGGIE